MAPTILSKTHPLHDDLAIGYYKRGSTPQQAIDALKAANYTVKGYRIDAVVVANILRGIYLAQALIPAKKTRTKKSA